MDKFKIGTVFSYTEKWNRRPIWTITGVIINVNMPTCSFKIIKMSKEAPTRFKKEPVFHINSVLANNAKILGTMSVETAKVLYG